MNDQPQTNQDKSAVVTPTGDPKKDQPSDPSKQHDQPNKPPAFDKAKEQQARK